MLSKFSVKKPYTVVVGVVLIIILGVVSFSSMTVDLLPSMNLPYAIVMTTYIGASPEEVEQIVTKPVEQTMATVSNIKTVQSISNENASTVVLEFDQTANMDSVTIEMRESLDQIQGFWPDEVSNPIIMKLNPDMLPIMIAAVGVEGMDNGQISTYVQDWVMPELESIEGVASVEATGLLEESINVIIRQEKVDQINEKIFAAIDEKMEEARLELEDGRKELEDGLKELEKGQRELQKGKKEIQNGRKELEAGKEELEAGRIELDEKKAETAQTLAETKKDLLTAKADLEAAKINMTTNLEMAQKLYVGLNQISSLTDILTSAPERYLKAYRQLFSSSVSGGDPALGEQARKDIEQLKQEYMESEIISQIKGKDAQMDEVLKNLEEMDWTDSRNFVSVAAMLTMISQGGAGQINAQKENLYFHPLAVWMWWACCCISKRSETANRQKGLRKNNCFCLTGKHFHALA